jgi:hypothetical protein
MLYGLKSKLGLNEVTHDQLFDAILKRLVNNSNLKLEKNLIEFVS